MSRSIEELRNLGPRSAEQLRAVGISTEAELRSAGVEFAYLAVRQRNSSVSLNLLWALYGALHDVDWRDVSDGTKAALREAIER